VKILITIPSFAPHGGTRIIVEWANRLSKMHSITLLTNHDNGERLGLLPDSQVTTNDDLTGYDCLIGTSPHFSHLFRYKDAPAKQFAFMQMIEGLFNPTDKAWQEQCHRFYHCDAPMFIISNWNEELLDVMGRKREIIKVRNGINTQMFPVWNRPDFTRHTLLIESPIATNPTKDISRHAMALAKYARLNGIRTIGYGAVKLQSNDVAKYIQHPSIQQLNDLYKEATIMVKCTRFDASSTAPIEAMTKGCVVIRSIIAGDDLLVHERNCLRTTYNLDETTKAFKRLINDRDLYNNLKSGGYATVDELNWDPIIEQINKHLQ
jgi:glycosyltransferase involved in cell wall biosynthesis